VPGGSCVIVDGFAGPGGWSEGLRLLGRSELGIEWDAAACETARAAGHERLQADIAALDPVAFTPVEGAIFSPPCPSFSAAGSRKGLSDVEYVIACASEFEAGRDTRAEHGARCADERSILSVEPIRWVLALMPEWVALEQVPAVLPIWEHFGRILERRGYSVWTGVLEAERYGVPQTRERAVLMASRLKVVHPPQATHQRYVPGEPQRHDFTLEGEVLPWVSMAEALGWGATARPYPTVACSSSTGGPDMEKVGGSGARRQLYEEQESGRWVVNYRRGGDRIDESTPVDAPAPAITSRFDRWQIRPEWPQSRPATAVCGDPRIFEPGWRGAPRDYEPDGTYIGKRAGDNAIRVSIEEAAVLQSFRPDYPWRGNKSETFRQVGNAVPPLLARAILAELLSAP